MTSASDFLSHKNFIFEYQNLRLRPTQQQMAESVHKVLKESQQLAIEAPTATGKTLAYLVPTLLWLQENPHEKAIICTKTLTLQEQLFSKDLPMAEKLTNWSTPAMAIRGTQQYLCRHQLQEKSMSTPENLRDSIVEIILKVNLEQKGRRQDFPTIANDAWSQIAVAENRCHGQQCSHASNCEYLRDRQQLASARLIITNHAFFLTDMKRGLQKRNNLLPQNTAIIIDEALGFDRTACDNLAWEISEISLKKILELQRHTLYYSNVPALKEARQIIQRLLESNHLFFKNLNEWCQKQEIQFPHILSEEAWPDYFSSDMLLVAKIINDSLARESKTEVRARLKVCATELRQLAMEISHFLLFEKSNLASIDAQNGKISLKKLPLRPDKLLAQQLYNRQRPLILTSATLAISNDFTFFAKALGFEGKCQKLPDSLDAKQLLLNIPRDLPEPSDEEEYLRACYKIIKKEVLLSRGRALILVNSYRHLKAIKQAIAPTLAEAGIPLLTQERHAETSQLLDEFKTTTNSVLIATAGFWQGVDIPGESLQLLIIVKLPFPVPDAIIEQRLLNARGIRNDDTFAEFSLPKMILQLRQGLGRLIRNEEDRGRAIILDSRIHKRQYGQEILNNLPPHIACDF